MNRILDTIVGPQSPFLGVTKAHLTDQLTRSNWHCKALPVMDKVIHSYVFITQQECQRSRQAFYCIQLQHRGDTCAIATFFELNAALAWLEELVAHLIEPNSQQHTTRELRSHESTGQTPCRTGALA